MTMLSIHLLALSLAFAGEGPTPAVSPPAPTGTSARPTATAARDPDKPPPGEKADQALWQVAYDSNKDLVVEQYEAGRLMQEAKGIGYLERLPELGKTGALPKARANELTQRLFETWTASYEIMQGQWPVSKVRVCSYELLNFETIMGGGRGMAAPLVDARKTLKDCLDRANLVLRPLRKSNAEMKAVLDEIGRELASLPSSPAGASDARSP